MDGMAASPGLPSPRRTVGSNYDGEEFFLGKVDMPAGVGTYLDSPFTGSGTAKTRRGSSLKRLVGVRGDDRGRKARPRGLSPKLSSAGVSDTAVLIPIVGDSRGREYCWFPRAGSGTVNLRLTDSLGQR
jgi:hypothetical protein